MSLTRLILVLGATAVGKSAAAIDIAVRSGGEIVNADSQQVYRGMDIGTGKPGRRDRERAPHHLIDVVDPDEEFDVARFRELASERIEEIRSRGKAIVVCGGTGLYLQALTRGLFAGPGRDPAIRSALEREREARGLGYLHERLREADPAAAARIHPNDRQRILRALEVYRLTGKPMSEWQREHGFGESPFDALKIGLHREREELYDLIDRRCESMVRDGLLDEVRRLVEQGYGLHLKALRSVGYRHMGSVLTAAAGPAEALFLMKRDTRRLAKRQLTWFRRDPEIRWFHPEKERDRILSTVGAFLSVREG